MHNLSLLTRKNNTNPPWGTFYKITGLYPPNVKLQLLAILRQWCIAHSFCVHLRLVKQLTRTPRWPLTHNEPHQPSCLPQLPLSLQQEAGHPISHWFPSAVRSVPSVPLVPCPSLYSHSYQFSSASPEVSPTDLSSLMSPPSSPTSLEIHYRQIHFVWLPALKKELHVLSPIPGKVCSARQAGAQQYGFRNQQEQEQCEEK